MSVPQGVPELGLPSLTLRSLARSISPLYLNAMASKHHFDDVMEVADSQSPEPVVRRPQYTAISHLPVAERVLPPFMREPTKGELIERIEELEYAKERLEDEVKDLRHQLELVRLDVDQILAVSYGGVVRGDTQATTPTP